MRKGRNGGNGKNGEKTGKKEKTDENSCHYVVCQQSTAGTPTAGTPHSRAKIGTPIHKEMALKSLVWHSWGFHTQEKFPQSIVFLSVDYVDYCQCKYVRYHRA